MLGRGKGSLGLWNAIGASVGRGVCVQASMRGCFRAYHCGLVRLCVCPWGAGDSRQAAVRTRHRRGKWDKRQNFQGLRGPREGTESVHRGATVVCHLHGAVVLQCTVRCTTVVWPFECTTRIPGPLVPWVIPAGQCDTKGRQETSEEQRRRSHIFKGDWRDLCVGGGDGGSYGLNYRPVAASCLRACGCELVHN